MDRENTLEPPARARSAVTRSDVARMAGTSVAVVSYVVNNGPRPVSDRTRQRVLDAIRESGYRPNQIAKTLAAGSSRSYGLVVPDVSNPFFAAIAHALEDQVFEGGRVLLLGDSANSIEREAEIINNFLRYQVDAILYIGAESSTTLDVIIDSRTPVVVLDRVTEHVSVASVGIDNVGAARAAAEHLIWHGYREIGLITGPPQLDTSIERTTGWSDALIAAGLTIRPEWTVTAPFSKDGGFRAGRALFAGGRLPRALFVASDQIAIGVLRAASEAGVRVPEDLALVTFDGTEDTLYSNPSLTTVAQPVEEIARTAIALLTAPEKFPSNRITCSFELVVRRSCGCGAQEMTGP
jgi:LacI family transcriptional regulator